MIKWWKVKQFLRFKWNYVRNRLHYLGWHSATCGMYKMYPVSEDRPRCMITGKFKRPTTEQEMIKEFGEMLIKHRRKNQQPPS